MSNFTIPNLKRALVEVKRICSEKDDCGDCPFDYAYKCVCPICDIPCRWQIDHLEEDTHEAD